MNAKKKLQKASDRAVIESSTSPSELSRRLEAARKKYHKGEKHEESERTIQISIFRSNEEATNLEVRASDTIHIRSNLDTIESKPSGTDEHEFNKRQRTQNSTTSDNYSSSRSRSPNSSSYNADSSSRNIGINTLPLVIKGVSGSNDAKMMGIIQRKKKPAPIGSQVMDEYSISYSTTSSTKDGDVMSACSVPLVPPQIERRGEEDENNSHSHNHSSNTKKNPKLLVHQPRERKEKEVKDNIHESILSNINIEIDSSDSGYSSGEEGEEFMVDDSGPSESESESEDEIETRRQLKRKRIQPTRFGQDAARQQLKGGRVKRTRTQTLRSDLIFYNSPTPLIPSRHYPSTPRRTQMARFGQYATPEQLEDLEQTSPSDFVLYNAPDRCSRSPSSRTRSLGRRSRSRRRPLK